MSDLVFSFNQVEAIISDAFGITSAKQQKTFIARVKQLQKMKLPWWPSPGYGRRVAYTAWQLCHLQLWLDMLDAGLTPAIANRLANHPAFEIANFWQAAENHQVAERDFYVYLAANTFEPLRHEVGQAVSSVGLGFTFGSLEKLTPRIVEQSGVLINLAMRLGVLKKSMARILPEAEGVRLFPDDPDVGEE